MAGLFGTDGVRARINTGSMTAEAVVRLALAAGRWFADHNDRSSPARPIVVIGKDTRLYGQRTNAPQPKPVLPRLRQSSTPY